MKIRVEDALDYHSQGRRGKIEVIPTKPCVTSRDLSLAYTPGVAEPCREIFKNDDDVYKYTAKGNLVAVVSNGTAVLGLGDIGAHAGKPVMEGKGVLFKRFADIDVFDIELNTHDPKEVIRAVQLLEPTFGGINLEDIKAPECFEIEEELIKTMNIPVFHDDQHGTAIISCAGIMNAVEVVGKKLDEIKLVINGAGAAAVACANLYVNAGIKLENIWMCDSKGVLSLDRNDLNKYKMQFAKKTNLKTLAEVLKDSDVFIGLSKGNVVSKDMVRSMARDPIVFAMANPDPEITYEDGMAARSDVIMATGRSDYPNQVNNVLGFPFIFRGALDVRAKAITVEMKMAAVKALADLAKEKVPEIVFNAYGGKEFTFAAMETGVARVNIDNWAAYKEELQERLGMSKEVIRVMVHKAQKAPKKVVYPEGEEEKVIRAANSVSDDNIAFPILLGNEEIIKAKIKTLGYDLERFSILDISKSDKVEKYSQELYENRQRKGMSLRLAKELIKRPVYFGAMMVKLGDADSMIGGLTTSYPETIKPALQCIGLKERCKVVSGMYIVITKKDVYFFADCTVNINPTAEQLAEIAINTADIVKEFEIDPRVAMLSFSNFGTAVYPESNKVRHAVDIVHQLRPDLNIDGEMQADTAVVQHILENDFPFNRIKGKVNVLIFPDLNSGNIAYKLMARIGGATVVGPIIVGLKKSVHVLQRGASVDDIINLSAIAVVDAKNKG